jgi:hypothetical protein
MPNNVKVSGDVALEPDDQAHHGVWTLSATPGNETEIPFPPGSRIVVLSEASARVHWNVNGSAVAPGANTLTQSGNVVPGMEAAIILRPNASFLRLSSAGVSPTIRVQVRGVAS